MPRSVASSVLAPPVPLRFGILLTQDFTLSAFADFVDVLRLAADDADNSRPIRCTWHVMSVSNAPIRASCGLQVLPTAPLLEPSEVDYVVVVGGLLRRQRALDARLVEYLRRMSRTSVTLVGICTGSFVLCRLRLLNARKCCISWFHYRDFLAEFPDLVPVADQLYVEDGNRITCSGGAGVVYLAAHLISRHLGASTAQKVLRMQQIDRLKPGSAVQPAPALEIREGNDVISRAMLTMEQHVSRPLAVAHIAKKLGKSTRQLERLFRDNVGCTPSSAYLQLRLRHARWMLRSDSSLAAIAADTGFADGSHFGKAFKAYFGINPSDERRRLRDEISVAAESARPEPGGSPAFEWRAMAGG